MTGRLFHQRLVLLLATGFGLGRSPFAPGTCGAVLGLPLTWGLVQLQRGRVGPEWMHGMGVYVAVVVLLALVGVPLTWTAAQRLGGAKDPGAIVWDEIVSLPMTFFLVPVERLSLTLDNAWVWIAGFALNRLFDITKPPPARQLERLAGGWGIMADDWIAGIYSCAALHGLLWLAG